MSCPRTPPYGPGRNPYPHLSDPVSLKSNLSSCKAGFAMIVLFQKIYHPYHSHTVDHFLVSIPQFSGNSVLASYYPLKPSLTPLPHSPSIFPLAFLRVGTVYGCFLELHNMFFKCTSIFVYTYFYLSTNPSNFPRSSDSPTSVSKVPTYQ